MAGWRVSTDVEHYFVTTTIVEWQCIFTSMPYFEIIVESLKYCIKSKSLRLHAYVIMLNHAHYTLSAGDGKNLSDIMRDFNAHTSREIRDQLKRDRQYDLLKCFARAALFNGRGNDFKIWREGFHPIGLFSERFFLQKLTYLHENPVRKGYVELPEYWKFSSARNYFLEDESLIAVEHIV